MTMHTSLESPLLSAHELPLRRFTVSERQPDLALVRRTTSTYRKRHTGPKDIVLLVEVAHTTLREDRYKAKLYAAAGIPTYWIINLAKREVEVFSNPCRVRGTKSAEYTTLETLGPSDELTITVGRKILKILVRSVLP